MAKRNLVLHLGFLNTPYPKKNISAPIRYAQVHGAKRRRGFSKTMTAEDVANILEDNYGILEVFKHLYAEEIMETVQESAQEMVRNVIVKTLSPMTKPFSEQMVRHMEPKVKVIEKLFKHFLDMEEMNNSGTNPDGVPTRAANTGKGRRSKRPGPSFIDLGIYRASFRARADIK